MTLQKIAILHLPVKFLNSLTRLKNEHSKLNLEYFRCELESKHVFIFQKKAIYFRYVTIWHHKFVSVSIIYVFDFNLAPIFNQLHFRLQLAQR